MNIIVYLISIIKFLIPLTIFRFPFGASLTNFILDSIDGDILMHFGMPFSVYAPLDKIADYLTYIVMFLVGRKWKIGKLIIALFIFRTIGQFMFFATNNDLFMFYFPNFLEPLFLVYSFLLFKNKSEVKAYKSYKKYLLIIWILIVVFKMWNEHNVHLGHIDLSEKYLGINN